MRKWNVAIYAVILAGLVALPRLPFSTDSTLTLAFNVFTIASLASSWNILAGQVGRINLGHAAFYGLGALATRVLWLEAEWSFELAFLASGVVAALAALILGVPALRLKGIYFSVGTLALAEALRLTVSTELPRVSRLPGAALRAYDIMPRYYLALVVLVIIVIAMYWLRRSKLGLGMMAVREDEEAARSVGIDVFQHTLIAFVLSAFFAGLVGGTFAFYHVSYYPSLPFSPEWTFDALLVTFVGGISTLAGPLVGATFFVLISDFLAKNPVNFSLTILGKVFEVNLLDIHLIIFGVVFIIVVLALPGGIIEIAERVQRRLRHPAN